MKYCIGVIGLVYTPGLMSSSQHFWPMNFYRGEVKRRELKQCIQDLIVGGVATGSECRHSIRNSCLWELSIPTHLSKRSLSGKGLTSLTYDLKHKEDLEEGQIISEKLDLFQLRRWASKQGSKEEQLWVCRAKHSWTGRVRRCCRKV